jgi:hypothetical protein
MSQPTGRSRRQWEAFIEINSKKNPKEELIRQMVADGLSEQEAQNIFLRNKKKKVKTGILFLFGGLVLCALGISLTISQYSSYKNALESGQAGTYYINFGIAFCGVVMFFYGLFRLIFKRN